MNTELALSPGLLASLARARSPRVLLLRHADREAIAPGDSGKHTPLTPIGEQRAAALRQQLGDPDWALSSPLLRCTRTAELLGARPETSSLLGAPGPFVVDRQRGARVFEEHGTPAVVRGQIAGETWGCMRALESGVRQLLAELLANLHTRGGTGVAISHDAIVMPVIAHLTGERFTDDWLAPLDGAVVTTSGLIWRGHAHEVSRC
jgi:broad specificity phosphatase PhoE